MVELVSFVMECGEGFFILNFKGTSLERHVGKDLNEGVDVLKIRVVFLRSSLFCLSSLSLPVTTATPFYVEAKLRNCIWQRTFC